MVADALDTEYENGVADVLAYLAGDAAVVQRNVRMPGRRSGTDRQIDVLVVGALFGTGSASMVVDCKRYASALDVNDIGTFVSLVEDVGADIGLLVGTSGASQAAQQYADSVRGIRLNVFSLDELAAWSPPGTVHFDYAVPAELYVNVVRAARRAGFRVREVEVPDWRGEIGLGFSAFRHFGAPNPSADQQVDARTQIEVAMQSAGVKEPIALGNGVTISGGTPAHRWLDVTVMGVPIGLKVIVSSEEEINEQLDMVAEKLFGRAPRDDFDVIRPNLWPIPTMFPRW
ncbi:restriction endonuclease [Dactylosporangium sp. NPDC005555]|uniref:restriction endonuclease n=1 Tax=Dactylosporangium sp. NPDC005555 TaxID=3154889 RepID=UPI0033AC8A5B